MIQGEVFQLYAAFYILSGVGPRTAPEGNDILKNGFFVVTTKSGIPRRGVWLILEGWKVEKTFFLTFCFLRINGIVAEWR